ncbi:MAG: hypothetical protein JWS12_960 [Candidatus Saccharibacteria bacterium]|nr:hypothetical protein [Candidatus Saccharibacteria bacterium]
MSLDTKTRPEEEDEQQRRPLFTEDTPQSDYDDKFNEITNRFHDGDSKSDESSASPEKLNTAEGDPTTTKPSSAAKDESDLLPDKQSDDKEGFMAQAASGMGVRVFNRRRLFGGGIIGTIIAVVFGVLTYTSGPLQFIHIAKLLQQFHFSSQENAGNDRMVKLARYIEYRGDQRTRLNKLGNAYANKIEAKLNESGITSAYTERLNFFDGYVFDVNNIKDTGVLADFKGKSPEQIRAGLAEKYNVSINNITPVAGEASQFKVSAEGLGYYKSKGLIAAVLEDAGYSKLSAVMRARIMGKRAGIDWHPMKKADKKLLETLDKRLADWHKNRQQEIDNGEQSVTATAESGATNPDGTPQQPSPEAQSRASVAAQTAQEAQLGGEELVNTGTAAPAGPFQQFRTSTAGKLTGKVGGVAAAIGILCMAKGIVDHIDEIKYLHVVMPLMRMGMDAVSVGNQVMSGKDVNPEQLGFLSKQLNSAETGSWANARSIQAEQGKPLTGPDVRDEAKLDNQKNLMTQFVTSVPGLGAACGVVNGVFGQVVTMGLAILGGPLSALGGYALSVATGPILIDGLTHWLAGHPIDINVAGADFGNYINYGARLASNESAITGGGRKLTKPEVAELNKFQQASLQQEQASKSIADRLLNPYDSHSLVSGVIDEQNPNLKDNVASFAKSSFGLKNLFGAIPKAFSALIAGKAHALDAAQYDYGFDKFGFSVEELNSDVVKNPYDNANSAALILDGPKGPTLIKQAQDCFGAVITKGTDANHTYDVTTAGDSKPYYTLPSSCQDPDPDWLRVRFYIFDSQIMESTACYEGDDTSCNQINFPGGSGPASSTPTAAGNSFSLYSALIAGARANL